MSNTIITVVAYPDTFSFVTRQSLPEFKWNCPVRNKILLKQLRKLNVDSPCHLWTDYGVEEIVKKYGQEFWYLGS
jgi:hypothetical protein